MVTEGGVLSDNVAFLIEICDDDGLYFLDTLSIAFVPVHTAYV